MLLATNRALIEERSANHALEAYASHLTAVEDGHRNDRLERPSLRPAIRIWRRGSERP